MPLDSKPLHEPCWPRSMPSLGRDEFSIYSWPRVINNSRQSSAWRQLHEPMQIYHKKPTRNTSLWYFNDFITLENRYGFWPQTGCVTVPGCEAAFLMARQRFPYRSRFNVSVKNMENMLPCNAICDIMHIEFSRKIYCGSNDASIGF